MKTEEDTLFSKPKLAIFAHYMRPYRGKFAIDMILSVIVAAVDVAFPFVTRTVMTTMLPEGLFRTFFAVMAALLAAYLLRAVFQYMVTIVGHRMGTLVEADMRRDLFGHVEGMSFDFFDRHRTGELLSRITGDLFDIVELSHHGPEHMIVCSLTAIGSLAVLLSINAKLTAALVAVIPPCLAYSVNQRLKMRSANREVKRKTAEINSAIESSLSGIRTTKAFAAEEHEMTKFDAVNERFKLTKVAFYRAMGLFNSSVDLCLGLSNVIVISLGGLFIMSGKMNYIDLITFTLYISTFTTPIKKFTQFMELYTQGSAGFERFVEIMRTDSGIADAKDCREIGTLGGDISFDRVSFAYRTGESVLENFSLSVKRGETVALTGGSGEGKTTIVSLLLRFYEPQSGSISVDGADIREMRQSDLRRNIGIIQQNVHMFVGTIRDNIAYGKPGATDDEIIEAAKSAGIHDDVMKMKDGYGTMISERGESLSGGQKQRISIARVFLKNPPILILDEATSSLDTVTETEIQKNLRKICSGKTCIIIAHRLSTIRNADRIAVIKEKGIAEIGSRDELLAKKGLYWELERAANDQGADEFMP